MSDPRKPFISPHTIVDPTAKIGAGTKVWHFANIMHHVTVGEDCMIASYVQLDPHTRIGDRSRVQLQAAVTGIFGKEVFIAPHASFVDAPYPPGRQVKPVVGDQVIIGTGAIIFPVNIGDRAVVSAGSVVTRDVAENTVVRGSPARSVGSRESFDLKRLRWNQNAILRYGYD